MKLLRRWKIFGYPWMRKWTAWRYTKAPRVYFPPGDYYLTEPIRLEGRVALVGMGATLRYHGTDAAIVVKGKGAGVEGFTIQGDS